MKLLRNLHTLHHIDLWDWIQTLEERVDEVKPARAVYHPKDYSYLRDRKNLTQPHDTEDFVHYG